MKELPTTSGTITRGTLLEALGPPLEQHEVDRLISGSIVIIKWGGGNGPHLYKVLRRDGRLFAAMRSDGSFVWDMVGFGTASHQHWCWDSTPAAIERIWDADQA